MFWPVEGVVLTPCWTQGERGLGLLIGLKLFRKDSEEQKGAQTRPNMAQEVGCQIDFAEFCLLILGGGSWEVLLGPGPERLQWHGAQIPIMLCDVRVRRLTM